MRWRETLPFSPGDSDCSHENITDDLLSAEKVLKCS
jgi:hypothetical protein